MSQNDLTIGWRSLAVACLFSLSLGATAGWARTAAVTPPCGTPPSPAYAVSGALPTVLTGPGSALPATLDVAHCVYWDARATSLVVVLAGRFRDDGGTADILARFGAISRRVGMSFRSIADGKSAAAITSAAAVTSVDGQTRRDDFTVAELGDGAPHYFVQQESAATGEIVYSIQVRALTADRLVVSVQNQTPMRNYFIRLYDPGDLSATYYIDRLGPGAWGFYGLSGIAETNATGDRRDAAASRAVAEFSHIAAMTR